MIPLPMGKACRITYKETNQCKGTSGVYESCEQRNGDPRF